MVYNDPHVPELRLESGEALTSVRLGDGELGRADCAVAVTAHSDYDWEWIACRCGVVVDTRNVMRGIDAGVVSPS